MTSFALGPLPAPAAAPSAGAGPRFAPASGDFWQSPALGLILLALIFLYFHTRIL
jgi:hypothetical protein